MKDCSKYLVLGTFLKYRRTFLNDTLLYYYQVPFIIVSTIIVVHRNVCAFVNKNTVFYSSIVSKRNLNHQNGNCDASLFSY